jgi:hypothetical protein
MQEKQKLVAVVAYKETKKMPSGVSAKVRGMR